MTLIPAFDMVVSRNKVVVNLGTLTDDYEPEITIHTTAADKVTGEKSIVAGKNVTIVDTVTLDGLEKGINDKARERAIVVHGANYADPAVLKGQQRLGRSLGCPALPPDISKQVIDTIKGGVLLYIYGLNKA